MMTPTCGSSPGATTGSIGRRRCQLLITVTSRRTASSTLASRNGTLSQGAPEFTWVKANGSQTNGRGGSGQQSDDPEADGAHPGFPCLGGSVAIDLDAGPSQVTKLRSRPMFVTDSPSA